MVQPPGSDRPSSRLRKPIPAALGGWRVAPGSRSRRSSAASSGAGREGSRLGRLVEAVEHRAGERRLRLVLRHDPAEIGPGTAEAEALEVARRRPLVPPGEELSRQLEGPAVGGAGHLRHPGPRPLPHGGGREGLGPGQEADRDAEEQRSVHLAEVEDLSGEAAQPAGHLGLEAGEVPVGEEAGLIPGIARFGRAPVQPDLAGQGVEQPDHGGVVAGARGRGLGRAGDLALLDDELDPLLAREEADLEAGVAPVGVGPAGERRRQLRAAGAGGLLEEVEQPGRGGRPPEPAAAWQIRGEPKSEPHGRPPRRRRRAAPVPCPRTRSPPPGRWPGPPARAPRSPSCGARSPGGARGRGRRRGAA